MSHRQWPGGWAARRTGTSGGRRGPKARPRISTAWASGFDPLERRLLLAVDVTTFHNDLSSDGQNLAETQLSPANVKVGSFGKLYATTLDGQVYAEPLVKSGVTIAAGPNTTSGAGTTRNVTYVATENDSVYAIDSATGVILWQRAFTKTTNVGGDINNPLGATAISPLSQADVVSSGVTPTVGITGTPVIDPARGILYVVPNTKETVGGTNHFLQRLHALKLSDGTDAANPFTIGDTVNTGGNTFTNNTPVYVYGTGDGSIPNDPYNGTGKPVVQFNAVRQLQRPGLGLVNGHVTIGWASNFDNRPYHGWIVSLDVSALTTAGIRLAGVLNSDPNGGEGGIWMGSTGFSFEADGSALYATVGNGPGNGPGTTLNAAGFPADGNYYDAVLKVVPDASTSPSNQNMNGWGLKVADYFIPYNQKALDGVDRDLGSSGPLLVDSTAVPGHPHLLITAGKAGVVYVLDRDNLGHFDTQVGATSDNNVVSEAKLLGGGLSTPAYANGLIYWADGYGGPFRAFQLNANGSLATASTSGTISFDGLSGSPSISANGSTGGIVWQEDRTNNLLRAFPAASVSTELWDSGQRPNSADAIVGSISKFSTPAVANGEVFVGTSNSLVAYGLTPPPQSPPIAPSNLTATALSPSSIALGWKDNSALPEIANGFLIEESTDNATFTQVTTAAGGTTSIDIGGLQASKLYYFRIRAYDGVGNSGYSNTASATTGAGTSQAPAAPTALGASATSGTSVGLNWTNNATNQAGFALDRATDAAFTLNLVTQALPGSPFTFNDTRPGLSPGGTYYYRIRASNAAGASSNSNTATVAIPTLPATPTNAAVTGVTTGEIDLSWTDNAGQSADGYRVERRVGSGTFSVYALLPAENAPPGQTYNYADTGVSPGTAYEYHIIAYNVAGSTDFAGTNAESITLAPSGLSAAVSGTQVTLSWAAPAGAVSYNVYRGTAAGAEALDQSGVTATTFTDAGLAAGTTYYYKVTAVNSNASRVPAIPSESAASNEASATIAPVGGPSLVDGGFESPAVGPGNFAYAPSGSPWAFAGGAGLSGNSSGFTSGNPAAPQGQQVAFLQGTGSLSQSVAGWAAGSYTVSFQAAQRGNYYTSAEDFRVLVDGTVVGTFKPAGTSYRTYATASFPVSVGSHTLAFQGLDTAGGDNSAFLDGIAVAPVASGQLVDGGFESPAVGPGNFAYAPTGSPWAFAGGAGLSGNSSGFTSGNPAAPQGQQVAFLQGTGSLSQSVAGWAAGSYTVSFQAAQRGNYYTSAEDFQVLLDGAVVGTFKPISTAYQKYTTSSFTVTAGAHTLGFRGLDSASGDNTAFLDSVTIQAG